MDSSGPRDKSLEQSSKNETSPQHQQEDVGLASKSEPTSTSSCELTRTTSFSDPRGGAATEVFSPGSAAPEDFVERELLLIKVRAGQNERPQVLQLIRVFRARVLHIDNEVLILEVTGGESKLDALENILEPVGILEKARSGIVSLKRRD